MTGRKRTLIFAAAAVVLTAAFLLGWVPRLLAHSRAVQKAAAQQAPPRVPVVAAVAEGTGRQLTLPGGLVAMSRTLIFARATGYVKRWLVDIGDHVQTDQELAVLATPDLDQQLQQARASLAQRQAALAQAESSQQYAQLSAVRQTYLAAKRLVAQQDADYANSQAAESKANVSSAKADVRAQHDAVRRLEDFVSFARVTAPYDGTISERHIEVGTLVNAGANDPAHAMYAVEATDPLRVFIRVPQTFAPTVHVEDSAEIVVRQYPARKFQGKITRTAGALEPNSRTLETEVVVPNPDGALLAGMYCEVTITVEVSHRVVRVPGSAVIFDAQGLHVATVVEGDRVHIVTVQAGRNFGNDMEIVEGLVGNEHVVSAPPLDLAEGLLVQPVGP
jgi:RND family efflux transporter MFP subunit